MISRRRRTYCYNNVMDYLMVYLDSDGEKRAAIPDEEGVYYDSIEFEEYDKDMSSLEVVVLESKDFYKKVMDPDGDGKYFKCRFSARYVSNLRVHEAIEQIGFTTFFTSVIKEHIREE